MMTQQQEDKFNSRLLTFQEATDISTIDTKLPDPVASEFIRWKSDLTGLEGVQLTDLSTQAVSTFMQTVLDDTSASAAKTTLGAAGLTEDNTFSGDNTFTKTLTQKVGTDVASAAALTLGDGNIFDVTGTTAITSIATKGVGTMVVLQFDGILTFTHHATDLFLNNNGSDITTAAGDIAIMYEYATGDWRCLGYSYASGGFVTGGNSHDHSGGDGAVIPYSGMSFSTDIVKSDISTSLGVWINIETLTASGSGTVDFETSIDSTYDYYMVQMHGVTPATNGAILWCRVKNGSTWNISTDYDTGNQIICSGGLANSQALMGEVYLADPTEITKAKILKVSTAYWLSAGGAGGPNGGFYVDSADVNGIRFLMDSGNIATGQFTLYGMNK